MVFRGSTLNRKSDSLGKMNFGLNMICTGIDELLDNS